MLLPLYNAPTGVKLLIQESRWLIIDDQSPGLAVELMGSPCTLALGPAIIIGGGGRGFTDLQISKIPTEKSSRISLSF